MVLKRVEISDRRLRSFRSLAGAGGLVILLAVGAQAQEEDPPPLPGPALDIPVDVDGDGRSTFGDRYFFNWWLENGGSLTEALSAAESGGGEVIDLSRFFASSDAQLASDPLSPSSSGGPVAQQGPGGNCVPPPDLPHHTRRIPPHLEPTGGAGLVSRDSRTTPTSSFIVFASNATNLDRANGKLQIYRFRQAAESESGIITHVSTDSGGNPASQDCEMPSISDDGMKIVFSTTAALLSSDNDPFEDVYLVDLSSSPASVTRVSAPRGGGDRGRSFGAAISGNGGFVAFTSEASDLVTSSDTVFPDANGTTSDVFRFNTSRLAMDIVSVNNVTINNVPVQSTTPFSTIGDDPTRCSAPVGDLRVGGRDQR